MRRFKLPRRLTIITALVAALVGGGLATGVAEASIPSSSGVFYACVANSSSLNPGEVVVKDDGGTGSVTCPSDSTEIQWSKSATAGPSGLDVEIVKATASPGYDATASCPTDHPYLVGGGAYGYNMDANQPVYSGTGNPQEESSSGNGWTGGGNYGANVYAICAK